jgi:CheY-like chemotaxis protein
MREVPPGSQLRILVVDDDKVTLDQFEATLPDHLGSREISWVYAGSFDEAIQLVGTDRFDLIATDIYRDREGVSKESLDTRDQQAREILSRLRGRRFTPVVVFSDSSLPEGMPSSPFVVFADKSAGNDQILSAIEKLIATGVPDATRDLHDELDIVGGEYLWGFLQNHWNDLLAAGLTAPGELRRLVRRRAATAFMWLDATEEAVERDEVDGLDFYLYPRISGAELRLGDVIRGEDNRFGVVLTPHCHLVIQQNTKKPRADAALVAWTRSAADVLSQQHWSPRAEKQADELRRRVQSPPTLGSPDGRYWFLPAFLDIPPMYCDFMDLEQVDLDRVLAAEEFALVATLDKPFAEALQSCFLSFYSAVGIPSLRLPPLLGLIPGVAGALADGAAASSGAASRNTTTN